MSDRKRDLLREVAQLADDLGPALAPAGHLELLRSITEAAKDLFYAGACSLALLDDPQENLTFYVASGAGAEDVVGLSMPADQGIAGWVVTSGQPIAIEDVAGDPRFASNVAQSTGYIPRSILAMPLETDRRMLGVISVLDRHSEGGEGARDMELLSIFARQAALAIENSRAFTELGQALFHALGLAADGDGRLSDALEIAARQSTGARSELADLARHFNELGLLGEQERTAATKLLGDFLAYVRERRP